MDDLPFPSWTLLPFAALVLAIAFVPLIAPRAWHRWTVQAGIVAACVMPIAGYLPVVNRGALLFHAFLEYASFLTTLGALYITAGGIRLRGIFAPTPATNTRFILAGALLASIIGTTGASMLLIRPFLATNRRRAHRAHLVPFFIIAVANAGGLLTPLGDPPLLVGYISGVPFFWTLRLFPAWLLYVGTALLACWLCERRAFAKETDIQVANETFAIEGKRNIAYLLAVVPAALLPAGAREVVMVLLAVLSWRSTPPHIHHANAFALSPLAHIAIVFAGLFTCLAPVSVTLATAAPHLPIHAPWQLFWASGLLSAVLDNAPTYAAFASLTRGVAEPLALAAVSIGCVVMGATTYIGNAPNLMIKAIADREKFPSPNFMHYAWFAILVMAPAHAVTTLALFLLRR